MPDSLSGSGDEKTESLLCRSGGRNGSILPVLWDPNHPYYGTGSGGGGYRAVGPVSDLRGRKDQGQVLWELRGEVATQPCPGFRNGFLQEMMPKWNLAG